MRQAGGQGDGSETTRRKNITIESTATYHLATLFYLIRFKFIIGTSQQLCAVGTVDHSELVFDAIGYFIVSGFGSIDNNRRGWDGGFGEVEEAEGDLGEGFLPQGKEEEGIDAVELGRGGGELLTEEGATLRASIVGLGEEQAVGSPVAAKVVGAVGHGTEREEDGG